MKLRLSSAYCVRVSYSFPKTPFCDITPHLVSQITNYVNFLKGKLYINKGLLSRYSLEFFHVMIRPFGTESFVFQFAIQKVKDQGIYE